MMNASQITSGDGNWTLLKPLGQPGTLILVSHFDLQRARRALPNAVAYYIISYATALALGCHILRSSSLLQFIRTSIP